jgi:hypothetical protein
VDYAALPEFHTPKEQASDAWVERMKDGPENVKFLSTVKSVNRGLDNNRDEITTLVVVHSDEQPFESKAIDERDKTAAKTLKALVDGVGNNELIDIDQMVFRKQCYDDPKFVNSDTTQQNKAKAVRESMKALSEHGKITLSATPDGMKWVRFTADGAHWVKRL